MFMSMELLYSAFVTLWSNCTGGYKRTHSDDVIANEAGDWTR